MTKLIVFVHPEHGLGVARPFVTEDWSLEEIALAMAPAGVPFILVDESEIPTTAESYAAWQPDFSNPAGIGVGIEEMHRRRAEAQAEAEALAAAQAAAEVQPE